MRPLPHSEDIGAVVRLECPYELILFALVCNYHARWAGVVLIGCPGDMAPLNLLHRTIF